MNGSFNRWSAVGLILLALLVAVGIGAGAYQAGVTHGLALQIPAGAEPGTVPPYAWYGWYGWHRPWGFGLGPILFILLWVFLFRAFFWRGRSWYHRPWDDVPSRFDEWHRRAHEQMKTSDTGHG